MTEEKIWEIEDHTRAKHKLLRHYLEAWFPILAQSRNQRVIFLDGFAGPGIYAGEEPGSPIIALETLTQHTAFPRLRQTEFIFIFAEEDTGYFSTLKSEIEKVWNKLPNGKPENITVKLFNNSFEEAVKYILSRLNKENQLAPTFAFIDPFGWSGIPMKLIGKLVSSDKCEVLINFMFNFVTRFVGGDQPKISISYSKLFGTEGDKHKEAGTLSGVERKEFLLNLYKDRLKEICRFKYVRHFELLYSGQNRTAYFLIHGTRHIKGLECIKDAMWEIDPASGICFTGHTGDQQVLFQPQPDYQSLRKALLSQFSGETKTIRQVEKYVIIETDYKKSHVRPALRQLEDEEKIVCTNRSNRKTYPPGTQICFLNDN